MRALEVANHVDMVREKLGRSVPGGQVMLASVPGRHAGHACLSSLVGRSSSCVDESPSPIWQPSSVHMIPYFKYNYWCTHAQRYWIKGNTLCLCVCLYVSMRYWKMLQTGCCKLHTQCKWSTYSYHLSVPQSGSYCWYFPYLWFFSSACEISDIDASMISCHAKAQKCHVGHT